MNRGIKNAVITSTQLGHEDHGILTCFLNLDYGGVGQGFGGYGLDRYCKETERRLGTAYGLAFIMRILDVLEVANWENLTGEHCRVDAEHSKIHGIGHILKDKWFYPQKDLSEYLEEKE